MKYLLSLTTTLVCAMSQNILGMNVDDLINEYSGLNMTSAQQAQATSKSAVQMAVETMLNSPHKHYGPLKYAAANSDLSVAEWLIKEKNADVNAHDSQGKTALMSAVTGRYSDLAAASDTPKDARVMTARIKMIDFLLDHGANINAQNNAGETPLMQAIEAAEPAIVKHLLSHGARTDIANKQGKTALMLHGVYYEATSTGPKHEQEKAQRAQRDKEIQDILKNYEKQRGEAIQASTQLAAPVARIVQSYLVGDMPKQPAEAASSAGAAGSLS